jgi:gas vesicle protein
MEYNQKSVLKNVGFFVAGGLIGAGLALLFAPVSGKEARQVIGNKYDDLKDKLKKMEEKVTKLGGRITGKKDED